MTSIKHRIKFYDPYPSHTLIYNGVVQPCRQSPHVATDSLNVATNTISYILFLWIWIICAKKACNCSSVGIDWNFLIPLDEWNVNKKCSRLQSLSWCNFDKCGDKEAPVATFVANVSITLDYGDLQDLFFLEIFGFGHFYSLFEYLGSVLAIWNYT